MHRCSSARTKSMAVASMSYWAMVLASAGRSLRVFVADRSIVLREKSCGGRASARDIHTIRNGPPTVGKVWRRLCNVGVRVMPLIWC